MRLTKKRLAQLDTALSLDDVLYERFRRLRAELTKEENRIGRQRQILEVRKFGAGDTVEVLQIKAVHRTPSGLIVDVC